LVNQHHAAAPPPAAGSHGSELVTGETVAGTPSAPWKT